jgi:FAD:protein FMN transferase
MIEIARARPWLGTVVSIRARGAARDALLAAIEDAFGEIAAIHARMSFHDADSDLSRLHRAQGTPVAVDARTFEAIREALALANASDGVFDPAIGAELVESGRLPRPERSENVDRSASWRDIELLDGHRVRLRRPLWIDLGGIAKGYAADRALAVMRRAGVASATVNAGGDIARFGDTPETIAIDPGFDATTAALEVHDAAVATSSTAARERSHWHARRRRAVTARRSVTVAASSCCLADALTKIVLADDDVGRALLRRHDATAWILDDVGWRELAPA